MGDSANPDPDSNVSATIKSLVGAHNAIEGLEPILFRLLIQPDAHWDEPDRCPSVMESERLRRAACRFARFCALPSELQQRFAFEAVSPRRSSLNYSSHFLARLDTIEVFELVHFVDGLRKMVYLLDADGAQEADGRVSRLVSTGPANIWRLWNLRPAPTQSGEGTRLAEFRQMMAAAGAGTDDGAFDDAFHHFEVSQNLSAFDATRTRALLDVGHQQTEEALLQLESLMEPPSPTPKPKRPRFRSLKLPLCDSSNKKSAQLPFLSKDLNSLPVRSDIPYFMLVLNGEPRIMPLNPRQLAEVVNTMHL
ncbi:hypothetical protein B0H17DRAFT_715428 [Mycena rosella]|uniref:Uncharacterized protein n=1 Tax=Mycena rosella TaxID=1033263 RepID=A0AAD7DA37_MYCRO|nr:hypothetical protein B0H17DRAFT_715428 [Mycena rosella]